MFLWKKGKIEQSITKTISLVDNGILGNFAHIHSVQKFPWNNCQQLGNFKDKQRIFRLKSPNVVDVVAVQKL